MQRIVVPVAACLVAGACGKVNSDGPADAAQIDATPPPCDTSMPFGEPVPLPGLNTAADEAFAYMTQDRLTVFFDRDGQLYTATRNDPDGDFTTITELDNLNDDLAYDGSSVLSRDGRTLYFETNRDGTLDVYYATRSTPAGAFGDPEPLLNVNTDTADESPTWISADDTELYMTRRAPGGDWDTYRTTRANPDQAFEEPDVVSPLDDPDENECCTVLTDDGRDAFFSGGDSAVADTWHAHRSTTDDGFGTPAPLTELGLSEGWVNWVSGDGCYMTLTSRGLEGAGEGDVFLTARPE